MLPQNYLDRGKVKGWLFKALSTLHIFNILLGTLPYGYLSVMMIYQSSFDAEIFCVFLFITSVCVRVFLLWARREEFASIIDEHRQLWSFLRNEDEKSVVKSYERISNFFRIYFLVSGYATPVTFFLFAYFNYFHDADGNICRHNLFRFV